MWRSVSTLALAPSRIKRSLGWVLSGLLGLSVLCWPAESVFLWPAFILLVPVFYCLSLWAQSKLPLFCTLSANGDLRWHQDELPAGNLISGSIICRFGVWLCWQDLQGKPQKIWLFCDQVSEADFRLLGRYCQQLRWQQAG